MSAIASRPPGRSSRGLLEDATLVRRQVDDAVGNDAIRRVGFEAGFFDVALEVGDVAETGCAPQALGFGELLLGHVDAEHAPGRADLERSDERVQA
jgi:hypothetical protein